MPLIFSYAADISFSLALSFSAFSATAFFHSWLSFYAFIALLFSPTFFISFTLSFEILLFSIHDD
jgi:hypothetical protein